MTPLNDATTKRRPRRSPMIVLTAVALLIGAPVVAEECEHGWQGEIGQPGMNEWVFALTEFDDGSGPALFAGGLFTMAGGSPANYIAHYRNGQWSQVGGGVNSWVHALEVFDDGSGEALYAAGDFTTADGQAVYSIARWNGVNWSPVGGGLGATARSLAVFDGGTGPALYVGGDFLATAHGPANYIARWDGSQWSPLGTGTDSFVRALAVYDDGTGPALYAGGFFSNAGGHTVNGIARWDGQNWSPVDIGTNSGAGLWALTTFDDGTGEALYAGGWYASIGGVSASHIAKWDGVQWSPLGSGTNGEVRSLHGFDDGTGPALYAGGAFTSASGTDGTGRIARWDGSQWSSVGGGMNMWVTAITDADIGDGPTLYAGGWFTSAGSVAASRIAAWPACPSDPGVPGDLNGDGVVDVSDLLILLSAWGACPHGGNCPADLNGDGVVDVTDLLMLLANWG